MEINDIMQLVSCAGIPAAMYFYHMKTTNETLKTLQQTQTDVVKTLAANTEVIRSNGELIRTVIDLVKEDKHAD